MTGTRVLSQYEDVATVNRRNLENAAIDRMLDECVPAFVIDDVCENLVFLADNVLLEMAGWSYAQFIFIYQKD